MSSEPLVTVVTPTHNRLPLLQETVASVQAQRFSDWEYCIIDDGSQDGTIGWLQAQAGADPRIRPLRFAKSRERARARNTGLEMARGKYILFLDDDDLLFPETLDLHLAAHRRFRGAIASVGGYQVFDRRGGRQTFRDVRRSQVLSVWEAVFLGWVPVSGQWLFRTQDIRSLGGWEGADIPIEDHRLLLKLTRMGPAAVLSRILLQYRVHAGQWRPANLERMMDRVRRTFIEELPEPEKPPARRLLAARKEYNSARQAYWNAKGWRALSGFFRVIQLHPSLLASPISRKMILPLMFKSLAGGIGLRVGGQLRGVFRRMTGRQVEPSLKVLDPEGNDEA